MTHIGWVPCNNFERYKQYPIFGEVELSSYPNSKVCQNFYPVGLQGYIIRKTVLDSPINEILNAENFELYNEKINCLGLTMFNHDFHVSVDMILNKILNFFTVYPPLIIERHEDSLLSHTNKQTYWENYFRDHEEEMDKYLS
jgi:hypothetical protein